MNDLDSTPRDGDLAVPARAFRRRILAVFVVLVGLVGTGIWIRAGRESFVGRDLSEPARAAVAKWERTLEQAGRGALTDADLEQGGVDAGAPEMRDLVDAITEMRQHADGSIEVEYRVESVEERSPGVVNVEAVLGYQYPITVFDELPVGTQKGRADFSSGSEGRYLTFVETADGLRLIRDVSDGKGHGGLTPGNVDHHG